MTAPQFRCDEPEPSVWLWGGIICPAGQRPLFDQLVRRMLGLSPQTAPVGSSSAARGGGPTGGGHDHADGRRSSKPPTIRSKGPAPGRAGPIAFQFSCFVRRACGRRGTG
jgi:hypothetical protein